MANRHYGRGRPVRSIQAGPPAGVPATTEPEVRRWPHPVGEAEPAARAPEPTLHYIRCALSYQNQLLADIKALLEQMMVEKSEEESP